MTVQVMDSCRRICSLRTWAFIVLLLSAVIGFLSTLAHVEAFFVVAISRAHNHHIQTLSSLYHEYDARYPIITVVTFTASVVCFTTSIFGIVAIRKNVPKYLKPYLYFTGFTILALIIMVLRLTVKPLHDDEATGEAIFVLSVGIAIMLYPFIIVKSYGDAMMTSVDYSKA